MTSEIFIENKQVDISEGLSNLITYAIDDIKDIGSRNTSFSKTIILPGTARNNALFGHIFDVTVMNPYDATELNTGLNFNASKKADCLIFQNHIQVFKGIFRLLKIVINEGVPEYECAVFGELGGLVNSIGNAKIEDLDFSAYDHVLSIPNVTGSWDNVSGAGYFYPLADYGNVSTDKVDYDISALRPALYVREYIQKIFAAAGYSYSFPLGETARFKSLVIPNNQKGFQQLSSTLLYAYTTSGYLAISNLGPFSPQGVEFDTIGILGSFVASASNSVFTYGGGDTLSTFFNVELNITLYGQFFTFGFKLLKNGSPIYDFGDVYRASALSITFAVQVADLPVTVAPGDIFTVQCTVTNTGGGLGGYSVTINEAIMSVTTTNDVYIDINLGDTIQVSETIPRNIFQVDFLSSILRLFNIYAVEDKLKSKFLTLTPFVDFYNASGVVDWTYKMDRSRQIELTPMSELNSRYYDFQFQQDSDYYNELYRKRYGQNYGDYLFDSEYFFTADKGEIPVIFSGTPLVGYSGVDKIVSTYYKLNNDLEEAVGVNIRILQTKKITGVASWDILNGVSVLATLTTYGYAGHYNDPDVPANDIHFGVPRELFFTLTTGAINVTQFNVYWSAYMAEITDKDSKLLTAWFKLTSSDIYNLNFGLFIYVDGSYFRLNKIIDWNSNEPDLCKVELLKVIYTSY